jgi:hypothetical protein
VQRGAFAECRTCPAGANCAALSNLSVSSRYYAVINTTTLAVDTFLCGGDRCAADGQCGAHRLPGDVNPLCGQCEPGISEWNGSCVACPGVDGALVFGLLALAWLLVLALHALSQRASDSSALRITMYMWQVAFLVVGSADWLSWAGFLDLNVSLFHGNGSACPFPVSPAGMMLVRLLGPLLMFVLLAFTAVIHAAASRVLQREAYGRAQRPSGPALNALLRCRCGAFQWTPYARSVLSLYFFTFNQVTRQGLEFFSCMSVTTPDGRGQFVVSLPALRCDSDAHGALTALAVILLFAYGIAAPAWLLWKLWTLRGQRRLHDTRSRPWWGVASAALREDVFWWGMLQLLFRAALVGAVALLYNDDTARMGMVALVNFCAVLLQVRRAPGGSSLRCARAHPAVVGRALSSGCTRTAAMPTTDGSR